MRFLQPSKTTCLDGINDPSDDYRKYYVAYEVGSLGYRPRNDSGASCRESALLKGDITVKMGLDRVTNVKLLISPHLEKHE